jgi:MFS family permease
MATSQDGQSSERSSGATDPDPGQDPRRGGVISDDAGVWEAHRRYGGFDFPASLGGLLAALAMLAILTGVAGAILSGIGIEEDLNAADDVSVGAVVAGVIVLLLAFLVGGWVAGRMSRYDGGRNGLMTAVWGLILAAVMTGIGAWLGAEFNVAERLNLPRWFSSDFTAGAIIGGILGIAAMLVGGWLGGRFGERWHRKPDSVISSTREGGLASPIHSDRVSHAGHVRENPSVTRHYDTGR